MNIKKTTQVAQHQFLMQLISNMCSTFETTYWAPNSQFTTRLTFHLTGVDYDSWRSHVQARQSQGQTSVQHTRHHTRGIWSAAATATTQADLLCSGLSSSKNRQVRKSYTTNTMSFFLRIQKKKKIQQLSLLGYGNTTCFCVFFLRFSPAFFSSKSHLDLYKIRSGEKCSTEKKRRWKEDTGWDTLQINHTAPSYSAPPPPSLAHTHSHAHICPS